MKTACLIFFIFASAIPASAQISNYMACSKGRIFGKVNSPFASTPKNYYLSSYDSLQKQMPQDKLFKDRDNLLKGGFTFKSLPLAKSGDHIFKLIPLAKSGDYKFELIPLNIPEIDVKIDK